MNIIVAVDKKWGIGNKGELLVSIPNDKKLFREETFGKVIIMGRKTFESLPGKQALYGRENIVLSADKSFSPKNTKVFSSVEAVLEYLKKSGYSGDDIYIIGGESIYKQFLPYCDTAHVTAIDYIYEADKYMQNLDALEEWKLVVETEEETYFDIAYSFKLYKKTKYEK